MLPEGVADLPLRNEKPKRSKNSDGKAGKSQMELTALLQTQSILSRTLHHELY
jgi:hypothetical protein